VTGALPAGSTALYAGFEIAIQARNHRDIVYGMFVAIKLWCQSGNTTCAAEWTELLLNTPGVDSPERRELQSIRAELIGTLGAGAFAAAERGKTLDLQTVAEHIMLTLAEARHTLPE